MNTRSLRVRILLAAGAIPVAIAALLTGIGVAATALAEARLRVGTTFEVENTISIDGEEFPGLAALPPPPIPKDNPQSVDADGWPLEDDPKATLGKLLFFDARLSGDASVSCSTCHAPDEGWGLNSAISRGYPGISHWRNSHTVINSAYQGELFWDGHTLSLETQAPSAAQGLSGNGKLDMMEQRIRQIPDYVRQFEAIFGNSVNVVKDSWRAIAAFERTLTQRDTPFDRYMHGDETALSEEQIRGKELFEGKARCIVCHNGPLLSDEKYYNLAVPLQESFLEDPLQQAGHRSQTYIRGVPEDVFRKTKLDLGLYLGTHRKEDMYKFRTQPLRYLEFTPPYMHNGVFDDLEEVVEFYNKGGEDDPLLWNFGFSTKTDRLKELNLTEEEKEDLVSFLESLSGDEILMEQPHLPEYEVLVQKAELQGPK